MEKFFVGLLEQFTGMPGYLLLAACSFVENLVPPIPGDTVTVFGGYLAASGRLSLTGTVVSTTAGSWIGFLCMMWVGRLLGRDFFLARERRLFPRDRFHRAAVWFNRFGYGVVVANRFLPGARSVISICAGLAGLHVGWVALCSLLSCAVWNGLLIAAGYELGENWERVLDLLQKYNTAVLSLGGAVALVFVFRRLWRRRKGDKKR